MRLDAGLGLAVQRDAVSSVKWLNFLSPFSYTVWLAYLGAVLVCAACFYAFERNKNEDLVNASLGNERKQLAFSLWHVLLNFLQNDTGLRPATVPGRLLVIAMQFTSLIVLATYTGSVASSLTAQIALTPYSGIEDVRSGRISPSRVGVRPGTAQAAWYTREVRDLGAGAESAWFVKPNSIHKLVRTLPCAQLSTATFFPIGDTDTGFAALREGLIDAFVGTASGIEYEIHHQGTCDGALAGCVCLLCLWVYTRALLHQLACCTDLTCACVGTIEDRSRLLTSGSRFRWDGPLLLTSTPSS